ncbi:MAG: cyanophycinase [Thermanaerothrix sp.]|nr:cyanophycinase [Thermanaerothrix sp.]
MWPVVMLMGGCISPVDECLAVFLRQAGGAGARVAILPTACESPQVANAYARGLMTLGLHHPPFILPIWERAQAEDRALLRILSQTSGLLILGGNVIRLLAVVRGTWLHQILRKVAIGGMPIAGISAGAAVMGAIVLCPALGLDTLCHQFSGLGVFPSTIVVPHFRQRGRQMILMQMLMSYPGWLGLGVDEATAALIDAEGLHSIGSGLVTLMMSGSFPLYPSSRSFPWIIRLHSGQSLNWDAIPVQSWPMSVDSEKYVGCLSSVTGAADIVLHFFKQ